MTETNSVTGEHVTREHALAQRLTPGDHAAAMRLALQLAARGPRGENPQVGSVLVDPDGRVVAAGWHRGAGTPHAEADALSRLPHDAEPSELTAYVTLEPCRHQGRTGPCTRALLAAGIRRVVYGLADPNPAAAGGAEELRANGVDVTGGVLADEVAELLAGWLDLVRIGTGRPFVQLKWAASLDGRLAAADGSSRWITGGAARARVHEYRAAADAVLTTTGTVLADDPALTARRADGSLHEHQPRVLVLGERPLPADAAVLRHPGGVRLSGDRQLAPALARLHDEGVRTVFVEAGSQLLTALLREQLADELLVFLAPTLLGGPHTAIGDLGVTNIEAQRRLRIERVEQLGDDLLLVARPRQSRATRTEGNH